MQLIKRLRDKLERMVIRRASKVNVESIINANVNDRFTADGIWVIETLIDIVRADREIKRGDKVIYIVPSLKEVSIYQVQKCREMMSKGIDKWLEVWCNGHKLTKIGDIIKAKKYVKEQLEIARKTEVHYFGEGEQSDVADHLSIPMATLGVVKIIADYKNIDTDKAGETLYENAIVILIKYDRDNKQASRHADK